MAKKGRKGKPNRATFSYGEPKPPFKIRNAFAIPKTGPEPSIEKRVRNALARNGGRASLDRVVDFVNKDGYSIPLYSSIKATLKSIAIKKTTISGNIIYEQRQDSSKQKQAANTKPAVRTEFPKYVPLNGFLSKKRKAFFKLFERMIRFDEGYVLICGTAVVFVWNEKDGLQYKIDCRMAQDSKSYAIWLRSYEASASRISEEVKDAFMDMSYDQLCQILSYTQYGGESKQELKFHRRLLEAIGIYTDEKTKHEESEEKEDPHIGWIKALELNGGKGALYQILRSMYGNSHIPVDKSIEIKSELEKSSLVHKVNEMYFLNNNADATVRKKTEIIPDQQASKSELRHATLSPREKILVVKRDLFTCLSKNHEIESLLVDIPVVKNGEIGKETVEIQHCKTEDKFFIFEPDFYLHVYRYGKTDCKNVLRTFIFNGKYWGMYYSPIAIWSSESPLMVSGYNVSQQKNLSARERRRILDNIIDLGVLSLHDVKNYLSLFASTLGEKPENWLAKQKWEEDLQYLQDKYKGKYIGTWKGKIRFRDEFFEIDSSSQNH